VCFSKINKRKLKTGDAFMKRAIIFIGKSPGYQRKWRGYQASLEVTKNMSEQI